MSSDLTQSDMNQVQAFFRGTQALCNLAAEKVIPVLTMVISPTDYDEALIATYYRMQYWLLALEKLNHPQHFQTVMNAARGIYELLLDLKFLKAHPSYAQKFHAFAFVARYAAAKRYTDALDEYPNHSPPTKSPKPDKRRAFVLDPANQKKFDDERRTHWGLNNKNRLITPEHWSALAMPDRALRLGPDELLRYRHVYAQYCWFVHPGTAGTSGVSPKGLLAAFTWGHATLQGFFFEGTELICDDLKLFVATPSLRNDLELARVETGRSYMEIEGLQSKEAGFSQ